MHSTKRDFVELLNSLIEDYIETSEEMFLRLAEQLCQCHGEKQTHIRGNVLKM